MLRVANSEQIIKQQKIFGVDTGDSVADAGPGRLGV